MLAVKSTCLTFMEARGPLSHKVALQVLDSQGRVPGVSHHTSWPGSMCECSMSNQDPFKSACSTAARRAAGSMTDGTHLSSDTVLLRNRRTMLTVQCVSA